MSELKTALTDIVRAELQNELKALAPSQSPDSLLTRKEACSLLGISLHTLHDWTKAGNIPAYRIGTCVRYKRSEIEASLNKIRTSHKGGGK